MSSSTGTPVPTALGKLTVVQLKVLCKERKITGYSKLTKAALVQKLVDYGYSAAVIPGLGFSDPSETVFVASRAGTSAAAAESTHHSNDPSSSSQHTNLNQQKDEPKNSPDMPTAETAPLEPLQPLQHLSLLNRPGVSSQSSRTNISDGNSYHRTLQGPPHMQQSDSSSSLNASLDACTTSQSEVFTLANAVLQQIPQTTRNVGTLDSLQASHLAGSDASPLPSRSMVGPHPTGSGLESPLATPHSDQNLKRPCTPAALPPEKRTKTCGELLSPFQIASSSSAASLSASTDRPAPTWPQPVSWPLRAVPPQRMEMTANLASTVVNGPVPNMIRPTPLLLNLPGQRFKPLIVKKALSPASVPSARTPVCTSAHDHSSPPLEVSDTNAKPLIAYHLDFPTPGPVPPLLPISLPPSIAQRNRVQCWAIILSRLSGCQRRQCLLVSRMFRYAVYLSAWPLLKDWFSGRRLLQDSKNYSPAMTNMWPYLRLREAEQSIRLQAYECSFLAKIFKGANPIAARLWASPDHEKQIVIALRFVITRLWFALSIGSGTSSGTADWLQETILDTQEVIKDEIWSVTVAKLHQSTLKTPSTATFYVLASTCEVVGHPPVPLHTLSEGPPAVASCLGANSTPIRADWSAYIYTRLPPHESASQGNDVPLSLLDRLKWANYEEYDRGISKLWLQRIAGEGELGQAKKTVAERYVLACVVGNSVSGSWMTTTQMAQEFAGLPSRTCLTLMTRNKETNINLYLPAHHHIESVHFTTSGQPLHPALAIIQTLSREYYILRDNGMEVSSEEEGVAERWMQILQCSNKGFSS